MRAGRSAFWRRWLLAAMSIPIRCRRWESPRSLGTDVAFAAEADMTVKLLGRAIRTDDGRICAYVSPHFVSQHNQLANVEDVFNGIVVRGDAIGDVMFYGRGAGKLPTASAVVADVIDAVKHFHARKYIDWAEGGPDAVADMQDLPLRWFVRTREGAMRTARPLVRWRCSAR